MKVVAASGPFGITPYYVDATRSQHGSSVSGLLQVAPHCWQGWDRVGVLEYLQRLPTGEHSCFAKIYPLPPRSFLVFDDGAYAIRSAGMVLGSIELPSIEKLISLFESAALEIVREANRTSSRVALALSGGLDSAFIYALMRKTIGCDFPVYTLVTNIDGYCEREQTLRHADILRIAGLKVIEVASTELVEALPRAIAATETPLFNLHPVTRLLLAEAMRRDGIDIMLTGDGADQIFSGSDARNYLPIVGSLTRAAGLVLQSPFLCSGIVDCASYFQPDPNKTLLRDVAARLIGRDLAKCPKTPRLVPDVDLSEHWQAHHVKRLSALLNCKVDISTPGSRMLWTTLSLLAQYVEENLLCAA